MDESSSHPFIIGGVDFGGLLYAMFVAGWLSLLTIPVGLMIMLVWMAMFMRETMGKIR